jgi:type II secretory pathway pseudopilin PulG
VSRRRRAFTLIEMIVAIVLGMLVLGLLVRQFVIFRRESENPLASMGMEQSTVTLLRTLTRELTETNLQSIRSLPHDSGVVMVSARDDKDNLCFTPQGTVAWKKYVFYQVNDAHSTEVLPAQIQVGSTQVAPVVGELDYDESTTGISVEPTGPPSLSPSAASGRHRVVAHNLLMDKTSGLSGCSVYYLDSSNAPHAFTDKDRGEPVCVNITLMDASGRTGQATVRKLFLQVKPKN